MKNNYIDEVAALRKKKYSVKNLSGQGPDWFKRPWTEDQIQQFTEMWKDKSMLQKHYDYIEIIENRVEEISNLFRLSDSDPDFQYDNYPSPSEEEQADIRRQVDKIFGIK